MNGLIRASIGNPYAVTVMALTMILLGVLSLTVIPIDILPVFKSPAVQTLTFFNGMSADSVANDITNRMERWTGQANGSLRQESRSIIGASIVRNYFQADVDPNGALTQVNSLSLAVIPNLPPGTLPPVVLPFDPTAMTPACVVAVDSQDPANNESILYDVGRYEVRNMIMSLPGAVAPVVYGGKIRAVMAYLDRQQMQARGFSPLDVMNSLDASNVFLPSGDGKFGHYDYVLDSNSMYEKIADMAEIPLRYENGRTVYLGDVATPTDANYIQTNVVRVDGKREVYIPVYRQLGASTLKVVTTLAGQLKGMEGRIMGGKNINLKLVMDQSIYVRKSIEALVQEGVLGAILCSLVILVFLGEIRMTGIAIMTLPIAIMSATAALYFTGQTINVMVLAGMTMAIGPMIDSAIICLENTHRHLGLGATTHEAAFSGASEVAMPELVSTLCTFLVLSPLVLTPGLGPFLFKPMAMAVAFSMISAYFLSRTLVPACSAFWLKPHDVDTHAGRGHGDRPAAPEPEDTEQKTFEINGNGKARTRGAGRLRRAFARWEQAIESAIDYYVRVLDRVLRHPVLTVCVGFALLASTIAIHWPFLRRDFFPEVDAGAFEMYVRAHSGLRIEETEKRIKAVEDFVHKTIDPDDLQLVLSELGVNSDWSAAYTPNAGPMDSVIKIQLTPERNKSAQEYVHLLRSAFNQNQQFADLEFAFDAGGMVRSAMNEGKSTPISIRVTGKDQKTAHRIASAIKNDVVKIDGVVDARIIQRLDYPQYVIKIDRTKAADLGLTQEAIMRNVVAAFNSSIQFNKHNFWIDPKNKNQYFVGVQYFEQDIQSIETLQNIPITTDRPDRPKVVVPLRNVATIQRNSVPTEVTHYKIQPTIELTMGVHGRDLGHVSDDVTGVLNKFGILERPGEWAPFDPASNGKLTLPGSKIVLSGEYLRMKDTFSSLGFSLAMASLLIYFLMVGLDRSFVVPLSVMSIVPLCLIGILPMLYVTGSAVNVQSLLGFIFIVGVQVANAVLMTDYAQEMRRHEGLSPGDAIRKAARIRVRPITMTALAAFFALLPAALAFERGTEANAPLARAILGGLLAGEPATLFVLPVIYSLLVRETPRQKAERTARRASAPQPATNPPPSNDWEDEKAGNGGNHTG
jgi:multidrug efflux pump subunit AcrB